MPSLPGRRARRRASRTPPRRPANGRRQEVTAAIYATLRDLIVAGRLAPGAPLLESDVSKRLGASRTPVRAAFQRLLREGYVSVPNGNALRPVVSPLTIDDMSEVFSMVAALEGAAARLAAEQQASARSELAAVLRDQNEVYRAAGREQPPDLGVALGAHLRLHRALTERAAGPQLRAELEVLQPRAERYERMYAPATGYRLEESFAAHDAIIDALLAGDAERAAESVEADRAIAAGTYHHLMRVLGERGNW
jgi:DNA-binding GntR family transcriptional regulator